MEKCTLIITEKPEAANRIATALDINHLPRKAQKKGVPYYRATCGGDIFVVPALGHLYTIKSKNRGQHYPVYEYQWVPKWRAERAASKIRVWLSVISQLANHSDKFVDACDFDIEGSIIGYTILRYACGSKEAEAKRMKYSTLTDQDLQDSFANLLPNLDFALVQAGMARHEIDWLFGINLSRALTQAAKNCTGYYATISTGRVQGPTLSFLEAREETINCFVPTPYWTVSAKIEVNGSLLEAQYEKNIRNKAEAEALKNSCKIKDGTVEDVRATEYAQSPPVPFDLGSLQREAYRIFKYPPSRISGILQKLYIGASISYPRTGSQKLPPSIGYSTILKRLGEDPAYSKQTVQLLSKPSLKPIEGKKFDPAHPAIYPTGNLPKNLSAPERNLFDLVVKRFLSVFADSAIHQTVTIVLNICNHRFKLTGAQALDEGWLKFYKPYIQLKDSILPSFTLGQKVSVNQVNLQNHFTEPPPRFNPLSLLQKMEKHEIGTKATRGGIIQTLIDRKYITEHGSLEVSELGFEVFEILRKYCPEIISPKFTRKIEEEMNQIQLGCQTKESVLYDASQTLKKVIETFKKKESEVGAQLSRVLQKSRLDKRTVGICPKCRDGKLMVLRSKKTGKRFVGCTNFFGGKCNTAFPLPQTGVIRDISQTCKICGSPKVSVYLRGKSSWQPCLNTNCPSKRVPK